LRTQAVKFERYYAPFAVFELMYLTGHFLKIINHTTDEKRKEILDMIEAMGKKAPGADRSLAGIPKASPKGLFSSVFSRKETINDVNVDNRSFYLVLKGAVLLSLQKNEECKVCVQEIIANKDLLANDKVYYVFALVLYARAVVVENREEGIATLQLVMKQSGFVWENPIKSLARRLLEKYGVKDVVVEDKDVSEEALEKMLKDEDGDEE